MMLPSRTHPIPTVPSLSDLLSHRPTSSSCFGLPLLFSWTSIPMSVLFSCPRMSMPPQPPLLTFAEICPTFIVPLILSFLHIKLNHFSTTGRCSGPAHYDVSIRQAARAAFVTSSFKIFLTQTFPRCGATCYILLSRAMTKLFNGVNFVYRSVEVYLTFCSYLRVLVRIRNFYNGGRY